jgi:hypothetical protein
MLVMTWGTGGQTHADGTRSEGRCTQLQLWVLGISFCSSCMGKTNVYKIFVKNNNKGGHHLEDLAVDGIIPLKCMLRNML